MTHFHKKLDRNSIVSAIFMIILKELSWNEIPRSSKWSTIFRSNDMSNVVKEWNKTIGVNICIRRPKIWLVYNEAKIMTFNRFKHLKDAHLNTHFDSYKYHKILSPDEWILRHMSMRGSKVFEISATKVNETCY